MCIVGDPAVEQTNSEVDVETFFELLRGICDQPVYVRTPRRNDSVFFVDDYFEVDCSGGLILRETRSKNEKYQKKEDEYSQED